MIVDVVGVGVGNEAVGAGVCVAEDEAGGQRDLDLIDDRIVEDCFC